jgi:hypothetical protein
VFYLIVETAKGKRSSREPFLYLNGKNWVESDHYRLQSIAGHPFACVSYIWGNSRIQNPLHLDKQMPDQTRPALAAAMKSSNVSSFGSMPSIPMTQPQRSATLESMGCIYSAATEVIVALAQDRSAALEEMMLSEELQEQALLTFENERLDQECLDLPGSRQ